MNELLERDFKVINKAYDFPKCKVIVSSHSFLRTKGIEHPEERTKRGMLNVKVGKVTGEAPDDEFAGLIARCLV